MTVLQQLRNVTANQRGGKEPKHHGASGDTLTICVTMRQCLADGLFLMVSRLRSEHHQSSLAAHGAVPDSSGMSTPKSPPSPARALGSVFAADWIKCSHSRAIAALNCWEYLRRCSKVCVAWRRRSGLVLFVLGLNSLRFLYATVVLLRLTLRERSCQICCACTAIKKKRYCPPFLL